MEGSFTDDVVHGWLQEVANAAYVSLHYDTPALGGVGLSEISGGGYVRSLTPFSQPANRAIWSLADARFTGLVQNQLTHFGIWDSLTGGRLLCYASLPEKTSVLNGWGYLLHEGELSVSIG